MRTGAGVFHAAPTACRESTTFACGGRRAAGREARSTRAGDGLSLCQCAKKGSEVECTDTARGDRASKRVTASAGRGDLHPDVVAVDEGDVVCHFTGDGPLRKKGIG